ncbi:MAG: hypothetical protein AAFU54_16525 [Chloroflexota bacterium]
MTHLKIFLLLAALLIGAGIATAQDTAPATDVSPDLLAQLELIEAIVIEVRGLEPNDTVTRVFPTREDVQAFLQESIDEQLTPEIVAEVEAFYYVYDFASREIDLIDTYLTLIEDQIGGYYDPEDKTLNTILFSGETPGDSLPALEQVIYAHEYVHALQDQNYGLASLGFDPEALEDADTDQFLAVQALVEGDATYTMNVYTEILVSENPFAAVSLLGASLTAGGLVPPEGTPPILMRELTFPYNTGLNFVTALIAEGGYEAVDVAFTGNLPQSTEQILHPQRYFAGDMPQPVTLGEGTAAALGPDWTEMTQNTLGEFYLRAYVDNHLTRDVWLEGTTGWGGDRYALYQNATGDEFAMLTRTAWDTPADSDEFAAVYDRYGEARFAASSVNGCWSDAASAVCYTVLPGGDVVIARAPSVDGAQALVATQS